MIRKLCDGRSRLLEIDNAHAADSGDPPSVDTADYLGYFENNHGEQWVFVGDRAKGTAALWGGDAGWAKCHQITADQMAPDVVLNSEESSWLMACWAALLHRRVDEVAGEFDTQARERAKRRQPQSADTRP
jgi:hypothetical protein